MAKTELTAVIEPKCRRMADQMGFELVDAAVEKEPTGRYLRFYIDYEGWWNTRAYVDDRVKKALGI